MQTESFQNRTPGKKILTSYKTDLLVRLFLLIYLFHICFFQKNCIMEVMTAHIAVAAVYGVNYTA